MGWRMILMYDPPTTKAKEKLVKNLRSYMANGLPSPSHSKRMGPIHERRIRFNTERQDRRALRDAKRSKS